MLLGIEGQILKVETWIWGLRTISENITRWTEEYGGRDWRVLEKLEELEEKNGGIGLI